MPAKSQTQRAYLQRRFGPDWMNRHHFDNKGRLPVRAQQDRPDSGRKRGRQRRRRTR